MGTTTTALPFADRLALACQALADLYRARVADGRFVTDDDVNAAADAWTTSPAATDAGSTFAEQHEHWRQQEDRACLTDALFAWIAVE